MQALKSQQEHSLLDKTICAARSAYYLREKAKVKAARRKAKPLPNEPLISILIPTHKRWGLFVDRALRSIANQTYKNFEIIVGVHGEETWDSMPVGLGDGMPIPYLKLIYVPRHIHYPDTPRNSWLAGPVDPLNAALKYAKGDWLARIDDDDKWTGDHLSKLLYFAQSTNQEFVSSKYQIDYGDGNPLKIVSHDEGDPPIGGTQTWLWRSYLKFMRWNRDCWRKDWNAVNDTDLAQRMRNAGVRIGHLDSITCTIRPRPGETKVGLAAYLDSE